MAGSKAQSQGGKSDVVTPATSAGNSRVTTMAPRTVRAGSTRDAAVARPEAFKPMPPVNTPMRLAYGQIKEQADAGDPVAQCRLAHEIARCKRLPDRLKDFEALKARSRNATGASVKFMPLMQESIAKDVATCQDFTPDPRDEPWRLALESALNGNHTAALQFVMGPPGVSHDRPADNVEAWAAYRQYAPGLMQRAIADGDSRAYQLGAWLVEWDMNGGNVMPRDPLQRAALLLALMPIASPSYRDTLDKQVRALHLGDGELAQAQQRGGALASRLEPPPDGEPVAGNNIIGYGRWTDGAECEH